MKNKLLLSTLVAATIAGGSALAFSGEGKGFDKDGKDCHGHHKGHKGDQMAGDFGHRGHKGGHKDRHDFKGGFERGADRKALFERQFSADEIRTLTSARLLMQGNDNLKVGDIETTDKGFNVSIVTKDNSLVEELALAPNAMPLDKYERIQQRMQEREARKAEHNQIKPSQAELSKEA